MKKHPFQKRFLRFKNAAQKASLNVQVPNRITHRLLMGPDEIYFFFVSVGSFWDKERGWNQKLYIYINLYKCKSLNVSEWALASSSFKLDKSTGSMSWLARCTDKQASRKPLCTISTCSGFCLFYYISNKLSKLGKNKNKTCYRWFVQLFYRDVYAQAAQHVHHTLQVISRHSRGQFVWLRWLRLHCWCVRKFCFWFKFYFWILFTV